MEELPVELISVVEKMYQDDLVLRSAVVKDMRSLCWNRWNIGRILVDVPSLYGDGAVKKISESIGCGTTTLYDAIQIATCYDKDGFAVLVEQFGDAISINKIIKKIRGVSSEVTEDNLEGELEKLMFRANKLQLKASEAKNDGIATSAATVVVELSETMDKLDAAKIAIDPQQPRIRCEKFLTWVRTHPCCVCDSSGPSEAHHVYTGGMGLKTHDFHTIPLCTQHHREWHDRGQETFMKNHGETVNATRITLLASALVVTEGILDE